MKFLVDAENMKEIDRITIKEVGIPSMVLMERAAISVAFFVVSKSCKTDRILTVCGMGNNGGDGVAVARILHGQGWKADIWVLGDEQKASQEMKQQLFIARQLGMNIFSTGNSVNLREYNVIIDAIFGIGLRKPITGNLYDIIEEINQGDQKVYSVDMPSGISADSGKVFHIAVKADYTITFGVCKIGLMLHPGCEYAGEILVTDIGFPDLAIQKIRPNTFHYEKEDLKRLPVRANYSNKGTFGKILMIGGSKNMSGACFFSAKAAYRSGSGMVKVLTTEENRNIIQTSLPEAILTTYDTVRLESGEEEERMIQEILWADEIIIGPGMGISKASAYLLKLVLAHGKAHVVFDADALNILARNYQECLENPGIKEMILPENAVLTPHVKEMARLCHCNVETVTENLIGTASDLARKYSCVIVLKDYRTVVTDGSMVYINVSGSNGMATGGSGDVLTGIIAALTTQGMEPFWASCLGVYIHGLSGEYAAEEKSTYSVMAQDIIEALPKVFNYKGE